MKKQFRQLNFTEDTATVEKNVHSTSLCDFAEFSTSFFARVNKHSLFQIIQTHFCMSIAEYSLSYSAT